MESGSITIDTRPAKKRRIPKACAACRSKKLACDEKRPCSRCTKASIECVYFERPKDPYLQRIGRIEDELERLSHRVDSIPILTDTQTSPSVGRSNTSFDLTRDVRAGWNGNCISAVARSAASISSSHVSITLSHDTEIPAGFSIRERSSVDVVSAGLVLEQDARSWFATFFEGCNRFVPVFDGINDTFDSVRARSTVLFDVILIFGARAIYGVRSQPHRQLYGLLREHTSDLVLRLSGCSHSSTAFEDIQALLVVASYSDNGSVLCDIALRASIAASLPEKLDSLFSLLASTAPQATSTAQSLFVAARTWYYVFVLDMILSIDGGKPPSVTMQLPPKRVRSLLNHPQCTILDIRLFAQVELNALRATATASIVTSTSGIIPSSTGEKIIRDAVLDLNLWLSEWQAIVSSRVETARSEYEVLDLNLRIQHAWALLTIHLHILTTSGMENIALMTDVQRSMVFAAKTAAEHHLQLLLSESYTTALPGYSNDSMPIRPYIANLKHAMEFVWAKNAFCMLIVLRLGILLGDSLASLRSRLNEVKAFLHELDKIGIDTSLSYTKIVMQTVKKCEAAIHLSSQPSGAREVAGLSDFETFIPKEFEFQWNFPGVHLCYIPLDWHDFLLDFGGEA